MARFDKGSAERGLRYARDGHASKLEVDRSGHGFAADVQGTHTYRCEWIATPAWTNACTCPLGGDCKHAYSAACILLALGPPEIEYSRRGPRTLAPSQLGPLPLPPVRILRLAFEIGDEIGDEFGDDDDGEDDDNGDLDDDFGAGIDRGSSAIPGGLRQPSNYRGGKIPMRKTASPIAAKSTVDPIPALFDKLHAAISREQRHHLIGMIATAVSVSPHGLNVWELGQEEDGDVRCALLAQRLQKLVPTALPATIEAWRDSAAAADKLRRRCEHALREQVELWAQPAERRYDKHFRVVVRVKEGDDGRVSFELGALLTSTRLEDDPRRPEQLRALLDETTRRAGVLSPASHALLDWMCTFYLSAPWWSHVDTQVPALERLLIAHGHTGLVTWQCGAATARLLRIGIEDGAPVRLSREGASFEPVCTIDADSARLELRVRLGTGQPIPLDEVVHLQSSGSTDPSYLLADGAIWRVHSEPPAPILEGFRVLGGLALDPDRRNVVLQRLASSYPAISNTLEDHTARVPSRAVFLLDGDADEALRLRLLAVPRGTGWRPDDDLVGADRAQIGQSRAGLPSGPFFEFVRAGQWQQIDSASAVVPVAAASFEGLAAAATPADGSWYSIAGTPRGDGGGGGDGDSDDSGGGGDGSGRDENGDNGNRGGSEDAAADRAYGPDGALPTDTHAAPAPVPLAHAWLVEPEHEDVASAVDWLRMLCPDSTRGASTSWSVPTRPPRFAALAAAWDARPHNADFFATRRVKRLLGEGVRPMPRLDIRASGKDFFAIKLAWQVEGESLSQVEVDALLSNPAEFVRLGAGWVRTAAREQMRTALETLADAGIDSSADEQRIGVWQLAASPPDTLAHLEKFGADPAAVAAARALRRKVEAFRSLPRVAVPRTLEGDLRHYQRDGLDFLAFTSSLGAGAVLADDMGLGKTVQTLAWLERLRLAGRTGGPALVVCPQSVVHNWLTEAARFTPRMRTAALTSGRERHELHERADSFDLLVTNYTLLRLDAERWSTIGLGALILDEAQNVKNPDAAVSRAVRSLHARHRLALTGTPLENRTRDIWSIVECVSPGYFGPRKRFEERFDRADTITESDRRLLAARLRPIMLRRRKSEVAPDLPARTEEARRCDLTTEQRRLYLATLRASRRLIGELGRKGTEGEKARIQILAALTKLRQICCHPGLVEPKLAGAGSAKFDLLIEVIEPLIAEGHKVLVFSQFARCIQLLAAEMGRRKLRHFVLTGATQKRERVVAAFQDCEEPALFLISLKAGGTGLNLTAASYVVLFDPWWNPAVEAQAIDRTHRIGQTKSVMAYRLVAADTIEEKILELQRAKASLADAVVDDETFGRRLAKDDLAFLLEE